LSEQSKHSGAPLGRGVLVGMIVLSGCATLFALSGGGRGFHFFLFTLLMAITQGVAVAAIVIAAGGFGYPIVERFAPKSAPNVLRITTACALGLWMLSTAVLFVGATTKGLLGNNWLWWIVIIIGIIVAGLRARQALKKWQNRELTRKYNWAALIWVLAAVAVSIWLAGTMRPPGYVGRLYNDSYDVLEYHLQVPREFFHAGHIGPLKHNCYSFYPLGVEMLYLLAMCLRSGAYEGMYLAKMLHGVFGVLAVAAIYGTLKKENDTRGRFSSLLLATAPFVLYLSWLAMAELAIVCYLTLALLWLREWLRDSNPPAAAMTGLMIGGACAAKYLSVGFVAVPIGIMMLIFSLKSRRRLGQLPLAAAAALMLFAPWGIRNISCTGNPVFPLATKLLGRGHWLAESQKRWDDGHGASQKPPVPPPPAWKAIPSKPKYKLFLDKFISSQIFGPLVLLCGAVAVCLLIIRCRYTPPWDWCLAGVLVLQLAVWTFATHGMPERFLMPALVPLSLLAGGLLAKLFGMQGNLLKRAALSDTRADWGRAPAIGLFLTAVIVNLVIALYVLRYETAGGPCPPIPGQDIANTLMAENGMDKLPKDARVMLIGDARGFYFPPGTIYATAFDAQPLAGLNDAQVRTLLKRRRVTHIYVDWVEIWRLAGTYGYPKTLSADLWRRLQNGAGQKHRLPISSSPKTDPLERGQFPVQLAQGHRLRPQAARPRYHAAQLVGHCGFYPHAPCGKIHRL